MYRQKVLRPVTLCKIGVVLGVIGLSFVLGNLYSQHRTATKTERNKQQQSRYDLLAARALIESPNDAVIDFRKLQTELESYAAQQGLQDDMSLYFEYLPTGSSIGINENKKQIGASLLKLPLTMSVYKAAEEGKANLDQPVGLKKEWLNSNYGTLYQKGEGYRLTTRQAAEYALRESDNTAALLLFEAVARAQGTLQPDVLGFIDANYSETASHEVEIDARSYTSILKCLYFACFLNKDNSQEILGYLSKSNSHDRLELYLPLGHDIVAHKIGVFNEQTQSDCGIFYVPKRNYALCVMIDGKDPRASQQIGELSRAVYNYVSSRAD